MKLQTFGRIKKVRDELLSGASRGLIMEKLSREFRLAPRTIERFITIARKEIIDEARAKKELMARIRRDQIEELADSLIAGNVEAEACLTQILRGEIMEEKIVYTDDGPQILKVAPKVSDILNAVRMHFQSQGRVAKEKNPPMLEPLGVFFSEFPLREIPTGDEDEAPACNEEEALNDKNGDAGNCGNLRAPAQKHAEARNNPQ